MFLDSCVTRHVTVAEHGALGFSGRFSAAGGVMKQRCIPGGIRFYTTGGRDAAQVGLAALRTDVSPQYVLMSLGRPMFMWREEGAPERLAGAGRGICVFH